MPRPGHAGRQPRSQRRCAGERDWGNNLVPSTPVPRSSPTGVLSMPSTAAAAHHGLAAYEVVLLLESDPHRGWSSREAAERLTRLGHNSLAVAKGAGLVRRILRQFHHPLIYVLLAAVAITALLGEYVDSAVILGVVLNGSPVPRATMPHSPIAPASPISSATPPRPPCWSTCHPIRLRVTGTPDRAQGQASASASVSWAARWRALVGIRSANLATSGPATPSNTT